MHIKSDNSLNNTNGCQRLSIAQPECTWLLIMVTVPVFMPHHTPAAKNGAVATIDIIMTQIC